MLAFLFVVPPFMNILNLVVYTELDSTEKEFFYEYNRIIESFNKAYSEGEKKLNPNDMDYTQLNIMKSTFNQNIEQLNSKVVQYEDSLPPKKEIPVWGMILIFIFGLGSVYGYWRFIQFIGRHRIFIAGYFAVCIFNTIVFFRHMSYPDTELIVFKLDFWIWAAIVSYLLYTITYIVAWFKLEFNR